MHRFNALMVSALAVVSVLSSCNGKRIWDVHQDHIAYTAKGCPSLGRVTIVFRIKHLNSFGFLALSFAGKGLRLIE
jgi:hypothetical protein